MVLTLTFLQVQGALRIGSDTCRIESRITLNFVPSPDIAAFRMVSQAPPTPILKCMSSPNITAFRMVGASRTCKVGWQGGHPALWAGWWRG